MKQTNRVVGMCLAAALAVMSSGAWAGPVNINTANAETIAAELDGVGITKARAIVAYRNANGPFKTAEALTQVTGIGERTVALNAKNIVVSVKAAEKPAK
ncbi:MAG: helix-hairpin-helix domain-containing protein [Pseudomonadota bacterium]